MKILVVNGPNINMLGIREPHIYGTESFNDLLDSLDAWANSYCVEIEQFQSNHEGALVDKIQDAYGKKDAIIINAGAYTHTSIALLDALKAVGLPAVEVHISNIQEREDFRRTSFISLGCEKTILGQGLDGYRQAIAYLIDRI